MLLFFYQGWENLNKNSIKFQDKRLHKCRKKKVHLKRWECYQTL